MVGQWIWLNDSDFNENERGVFASSFTVKSLEEDIILRISADTRYIAYINGEEIGRGPIRSDKKTWFYDTYHISSLLMTGENYIVVRVWNYGWSTYQSLASQGGVIFNISQGSNTILYSCDKTKCHKDTGFKSNTVKRNVNLGFSDYIDANLFSYNFIKDPKDTNTWENAITIQDDWGELKARPIKEFHSSIEYPKTIEAIEEVIQGCQSVSVNTRDAFFPGRRDANETIFSGFIGCIIDSPVAQEGSISFPNRLWNGMIGDFKINHTFYAVTDKERCVTVSLQKGRQLFLMQISGIYDDLYAHFEFCFTHKILFGQISNATFFVIGPTARLTYLLDGNTDFSCGVDKEKRLIDCSQDHKAIFAINSEEELLPWTDKIIPIDDKYVFYDDYILSMIKNQKVIDKQNIKELNQGMLWNNHMVTTIAPPLIGEAIRIIVDFKELYVGSLEFTLCAPAECIMDIYCFENYFEEEIDYTIGLNNSIRYITKAGWQSYSCMTRMGCRYAAIILRNQKDTVRIEKFAIRHMTYAPSNIGQFECNDYLLNKIWNICKHTHLLCMEDAFTDCPTYEQAFWIGDAQISSAVNTYLFGEYELIKRNLILATTAKNNTPLLNALTPTDWNTSIPMWTFNWMISMKQYVIDSGDYSIIPNFYEELHDTLMYYGSCISKEGAFSIYAWNLIDWAPLDTYDYGVVTAQQGTLAYCYKIGAEFAEYMDRKEDKKTFLELRHKLLIFIDHELWDERRKMFLDGFTEDKGLSSTVSIQTHTLLSLYDAIIDSKKAEIVNGYLKNKPIEFIDSGSPFMLFYLYETWARDEKFNDLIEDIKKHWGEMLYYNTTTCWEVFPGFYENNRTRSYCHGWSATPVYFMNKYILGALNSDIGFSKIKLHVPECSLTWVRGSIPTPYGMIKVAWERQADKKIYRIILPKEIVIENEKEFDYDLQIERI